MLHDRQWKPTLRHQSLSGGFLHTMPLLGVMAAIFILSHMPGNALVLPSFPCADKLAHGVAYGALAATAIFASAPLSRRLPISIYGVCIIGFCFAFGVSDEFHQSFIPGRKVSGFDVLADVLGAILVFLVWSRLKLRQATKNFDQNPK